MRWYGQKDFQKAPSTSFVVDGVKAGLKKSHGPLTFLKVYNAGHMVPMDQPKASLEMLTRMFYSESRDMILLLYGPRCIQLNITSNLLTLVADNPLPAKN
ncbi:Serine carboxypeptidase 3 [Sesamum angolense]|uniref:Serine carboxypeptidase 3 n=1 Tax=Sesamum angolense TaxID=2727404 RepID=A0AAE1XAT4_9LAMI|nr:Serine carboxypeptidase 3 [Sesamum angolense]